jgi:hypothetical protein
MGAGSFLSVKILIIVEFTITILDPFNLSETSIFRIHPPYYNNQEILSL